MEPCQADNCGVYSFSPTKRTFKANQVVTDYVLHSYVRPPAQAELLLEGLVVVRHGHPGILARGRRNHKLETAFLYTL